MTACTCTNGRRCPEGERLGGMIWEQAVREMAEQQGITIRELRFRISSLGVSAHRQLAVRACDRILAREETANSIKEDIP